MARVQCICEICSCGRHRCPHQLGRPIPSRNSKCKLLTDDQNNPKQDFLHTPPKGQDDRALIYQTLYQKTYQDPKQPKPELRKGPQHELDHSLPMDLNTTYLHDYCARPGEPTKSFKPEESYKKPSNPFLAETSYNTSFEPYEDPMSLKRKPYRNKEQIEKADGPMDMDTTMKVAFKTPENVSPREPYRHRSQPLGTGDMNGTSVYQDEFKPKPLERTAALPPLANNMPFSTDPFATRTTNHDDYAPYTDVEPTKSFKPLREYIPTKQQSIPTTTNAEAYKEWPLADTKQPDWTKPHQYVPPTVGMGDQTEYTEKYKNYPLTEHAKLIKPSSEIKTLGNSTPVVPESLYHESYRLYPDSKPPQPIIYKNQYEPPRDIASNTTTYQRSFKGEGTTRLEPIYPVPNLTIGKDDGKTVHSSYQDSYRAPSPHRAITSLLYNAPPEGISTWRGEFIPKGELHGHKLFLVKDPIPAIGTDKKEDSKKVTSQPGLSTIDEQDTSSKFSNIPAKYQNVRKKNSIANRDEQALIVF